MSSDPTPTPNRRSSGRGRKVRKVHRVVRHLDVWSVAKLAAVLALCAYVVGMVSGFLLWQAADRVGTIEGIEGFFEDAGGYDTFVLDGSVVFQVSIVVGLLMAALFVAVSVLGAVLFNLISDLTGGVRMTVIDEDLIVAPARRRTNGPSLSERPPTRPEDPRNGARPPGPPDGRPAPADTGIHSAVER
jgi:hypothetical protein